MSIMTWTNDYTIGVAEVDSQHRRLVDLINELHEAMRAGKGKEKVPQALNALVSYTKVHFGAEERLMAAHKFPYLTVHKNQHDQLVEKVLKFQEDLQSGQMVMTTDLMLFLKNWLGDHIMGADKQYAPYLKAKA